MEVFLTIVFVLSVIYLVIRFLSWLGYKICTIISWIGHKIFNPIYYSEHSLQNIQVKEGVQRMYDATISYENIKKEQPIELCNPIISDNVTPYEKTQEIGYVLPEWRLNPEKFKKEQPIQPVKEEKPYIKYDGDVPNIERYEIELYQLKGDQYLNYKQRQQKSFYNKFKDNFLNGTYLQLNGNYYYAELLLEDIQSITKNTMYVKQSDKDKLRQYIKNIALHYGESMDILKTCEYYNNQNGISVNGNEYCISDYSNIVTGFKIFIQENTYKNDIIPILDWICNSNNFYCRNMRVLINEDKTIDLVNKEFSKINTGCKVTLINDSFPDYIQFGKVECDFTILNEKKKDGNVICYKHDIKSLRGCPEQVDGNFVCTKLGLDSLKYCPKKVSGNFNASHNKITSFLGVGYVGNVLDISDNEFKDSSCVDDYGKCNDDYYNIDVDFVVFNNNCFMEYKERLPQF